MRPMRVSGAAALRYFLLLFVPVLNAGCGSPEATLAVAGGITVVGAGTNTQDIKQIYYLGVFDPREQTPSAIFRLTVRGQASAISNARFACGWVPAEVADSLNTDLSFQSGRIVTPSEAERRALGGIVTGRRLVLFGPEGFREAPRAHRLVLVMGSSPEAYFKAVRQTFEGLAQIQVDRLDAQASQEIIKKLEEIRKDRLGLDAIRDEVLKDSMALQGGM